MTGGSFLSHQPCPKCGSKNNLGVYSDGHSYCFGCGYYHKGNPFSSLREGRRNITKSTSLLFTTDSWTTLLPKACTDWLSKYQLFSSEIEALNLHWDAYKGLLIVPMKKERELLGYVGRRFKGEGSKYIIKGEKKHFDTVYGSGNTLVFVEDLISAIKVARVTSAKPLFGAVLNTIPEGYDSYSLWLDKDKQISSFQQCKKWSQFGYKINPIVTELDPKEYNTQQIKEIIEK